MLEQLPQTPEKTKPIGFDIAASIHLLRSDLQTYGNFSAETLNRIEHEELSTVAEVLDAYHDKTYTLEVKDGEIYGMDGKTTLNQILKNGLEHAHNQYLGDKNAKFWYERQKIFLDESEILHDFVRDAKQDEVIISFSPYPEEAAADFGTNYIQTFGPSSRRKQAFAYIYRKTKEGNLSQQVLTFDNSDKRIFKQIAKSFGVQIPEEVTSDFVQKYYIRTEIEDNDNISEVLRVEYDSLQREYFGIKTYGGRKDESTIEAWDFIYSNQDLVDGYIDGLKVLAQSELQPQNLIKYKKEITYGFWAAFKERLEHARSSGQHHIELPPAGIGNEMGWALSRAAARGDSFSACGGSFSVENVINMSPENAKTMIFGANPDQWEWRKGYCRVNNCPTKPHPTKIGPCNVCTGCQKHFDKGADPSKIYNKTKIGNRKNQEKPNEIIEAFRFWFSFI